MHAAGTKVGLLIQAFRSFGKAQIDDVIRARARRFLNGMTRHELDNDLKYAPRWIRAIILDLAGDTK
jgi:hypothetical protein